VAVILARRCWPAGLTAWLTYVLLLLPVIGITHNGMQIAADRYSYLPGLELGVLAGGALAWLLRRGRVSEAFDRHGLRAGRGAGHGRMDGQRLAPEPALAR
jgi:hypothetical protein